MTASQNIILHLNLYRLEKGISIAQKYIKINTNHQLQNFPQQYYCANRCAIRNRLILKVFVLVMASLNDV